MKNKIILFLLSILVLGGCKKIIDLSPESNLTTASYYSNTTEINSALTGCYNGLQKPMLDEWSLTELRSDNTVMGAGTGTTSTPNRDLSDLDMFFPSTSHAGLYNYWLNTYFNIRNINIVLNNLGVNYTESAGTLSYGSTTVPLVDSVKKKMASEASFLRAYHYFNLVRLYGGVFLIHEPVTPEDAKTINRSSVSDIYKLIIADLQNTITNGRQEKFTSIQSANFGRANNWCAKALLAKVYLTQNKKTEATVLLNDVINNSGYKLQANYSDVFSVTNEMNAEILFAVRYKAGGLGLGSPFPNTFAPLSSGSAVVNGSGSGLNYPTVELNAAYTTPDLRKVVNIGLFGSGSSAKFYPKKHISVVAVVNDAENDWPVIRFADVLLMLAEAQGNSASSIALINQTRIRAGLAALTSTVINTTALFEDALSTERRLEFAFENQRWFDLLRFNSTFTTITVEQRMKDHYAYMYTPYYGTYPVPRLTLADLQLLANTNKMLLPIPQHEIDTNPGIVIAQNPGY